MTSAATRTAPLGATGPRSPFAGVDVAKAAGLALTAGASGPVFDEDLWDFTTVANLPRQWPQSTKRWSFTAIHDPGFRLVAKELLFALLAPRHEAVAVLPHAYRVPLSINTCRSRLASVTRWLNWLTSQGITGLAQVTQQHCDAYLEDHRYRRDRRGHPIGELGAAARRETVAGV